MSRVPVQLIIGMLALISIFYFTYPSGENKAQVNILTWEYVVDKEVLNLFEEKEKVNIKYYEALQTNEQVFVEIENNPEYFDIVLAGDYIIPRLISEDLVQPLVRSLLPSIGNLVKDGVTNNSWDPGNKYCIPYQSGKTGFSVNTQFIKDELISWKEISRNVQPDGAWRNRVAILDDSRQVLGSVLIELGYDPNTLNEQELEEAANLVKSISDGIHSFTPDTGVDLLMNGTVWLLFGWSGDLLQIKNSLNTAVYKDPEHGSLYFLDSYCLLKGAPNIKPAHLFLEYLLNPKTSAQISTETQYGNLNREAHKYLDEGLREKIPSSAKWLTELDENGSKKFESMWSKVKR